MTQVLVPCSMHVQFSILRSQMQSSEHVYHDLAALQVFANKTGVIFHSQSDFTQYLNISTCFVGLTVPPATHFLSNTSSYLSS